MVKKNTPSFPPTGSSDIFPPSISFPNLFWIFYCKYFGYDKGLPDKKKTIKIKNNSLNSYIFLFNEKKIVPQHKICFGQSISLSLSPDENNLYQKQVVGRFD